MRTTLKTLTKKYKPLKQNKINTKSLIIELMEISSADFSVERLCFKLYKCRFGRNDREVVKWLEQLCEEQVCVFVGYKPEKVDGRIVGYEPIFGLCWNKVKGDK